MTTSSRSRGVAGMSCGEMGLYRAAHTYWNVHRACCLWGQPCGVVSQARYPVRRQVELCRVVTGAKPLCAESRTATGECVTGRVPGHAKPKARSIYPRDPH